MMRVLIPFRSGLLFYPAISLLSLSSPVLIPFRSGLLFYIEMTENTETVTKS